MKRLLGLMAGAALAAAAFATPASATPYSQEFNEVIDGTQTFDELQIFVTSPTTNASLSGFGDASWSASATGNPYWADAGGLATANMNFFAGFDYSGTPVSFDFYALSGTGVVDAARITYDPDHENPAYGYGISKIEVLGADQHDLDLASAKSAVPEPASLALFSAGLAGVAAKRRKKAAA